eukprot:143957-Pyramimonas_sp.AAC.2
MLLLSGGDDRASPEHPQTVRRVGGLARLTGDGHNGWLEGGGVEQAPESTTKKAFDFNSTVDCRR